MTEKEAWLYLAHVWIYNILTDGYGKTVCYVYVYPSLGICSVVGQICNVGHISLDTFNSIEKKLKEYGIENIHRYIGYGLPLFYWPTSISGAEQRAKFCRKQAELLP